MRRYKQMRRRSVSSLSDISLTPLIDTALTLLVIFMITTPMIHNAIRVNLPRGNAKEDKGERQEITIYVDKNNKVFFNGAEFKNSDIVAALQQRMSKEKKPVFVKADRDALIGQVFELVDRIKGLHGVQSVIFSTQKQA